MTDVEINMKDLDDKKFLKEHCEDQMKLFGLLADFDESHVAKLRKRATEKSRNVYAQYILAIYFYMKKDRQAGEKWLKVAAKNKYPVALNYLALLALQNKDIQAAYMYYHRSAVTGNAEGARSLADLLMNLRRIDEALSWFSIAADLGDSIANHKLGYIYDKGVSIDGKEFVKPDLEKAIGYYRKAATEKSEATYNLGVLTLRKLDQMEDDAKASDEDKKATCLEGMSLLQQAADKAQAEACYRYGYLLITNQYATYRGEDRDLDNDCKEGVSYMTTGANGNNANANFILGILYGMKDDDDEIPYDLIRVNKVVQYDLKKAITHLKMAEKLGHPEASNALKKYTIGDDA